MVAAPCQIVHVELSEHLRELELRPGYQSALIMFWWRGRPLGRTPLVAGEFPLPPASIAARAAEAIAPARSSGRTALVCDHVTRLRQWRPLSSADRCRTPKP